MNKLLYSRPCLGIIRRCLSQPAGSPASGSSGSMSGSPKYSPSEFQRFLLVWTKKYKSKDEIPKLVSPELIDRVRSEARIKIANYLMLLTALASVGAIFAGKSAAKKGESIQKINQDFHKQYREDYEKKQLALDAKK